MPTLVKKLNPVDAAKGEALGTAMAALRFERNQWLTAIGDVQLSGDLVFKRQADECRRLNKEIAAHQTIIDAWLLKMSKDYGFILRRDQYSAPHKDGGHAIWYDRVGA